MPRVKGLFPFSGNFEIRYATPLDTRLVANTTQDLTNPDYWKSRDGSFYTYKGMAVSVWNDTETNNGIYILKDNNFQDISNWIKITSIGEPIVEFEKLGSYHSFSKLKTFTNKRIGDEIYKSSHNIGATEVRIDKIPFAGSLSVAISNVSQYPNIIRRVGNESQPLPIYPLAGSNYLTWFIDEDQPQLDIGNKGFNPSVEWVRNFISPVDVMDSNGLIPSIGYDFKIYTKDNAHIPYNDAFYEFDYHSGFLFFLGGRTPKDPSNGIGFFNSDEFESITDTMDSINYIQDNAPRVSAFQYIGNLLSDIKYGNGLTFSESGELSLNIDINSGLTFYEGKLSIDVDKISIEIDESAGLTFSSITGELQLNIENGLTFSDSGSLNLNIETQSGLTFSDGKLDIDIDKVFINIDNQTGLTFSQNGDLQISIDKGLTFSDGSINLSIDKGLTFSDSELSLDVLYDSGLTFSDNKLSILTNDTLKTENSKLSVSGKSVYQKQESIISNTDKSPTGVFISSTPLNHSTVKVFINGQSVFLGTETEDVDCYFSNDDGLTAKNYEDITQGDQLYFNADHIGYKLSDDDTIILIYETTD
jgi:hypothetical protein